MFLRGSLRPLPCGALCGLLLAAAQPARSLSPGRAVEPAPPAYAAGPTRTGKTWELVLPTVAQVDYLCRLSMGGLPEGAGSSAYYWGCYQAKLDAVVLVDPKAWPSAREWREARAHEWAHARGWRHLPNGHGTDWARSLPPRGESVRMAAADSAP